MNRRRKIISLVLVVVSLCFILIPSGPPDPIYNGKHLSYWLTQRKPYQPPFAFQWQVTGTEPALDYKRLDTNAVPYLVYAFESGDGPARRKYSEFWPKLPGWLQACLPKPRDTGTIRHIASTYLYNLEAFDSPLVIPAMTRALEKGEDRFARNDAAQFLGMSHKKDPAVIQALVHGLNDEDPGVRIVCTNSLRKLDPAALTNAVSK